MEPKPLFEMELKYEEFWKQMENVTIETLLKTWEKVVSKVDDIDSFIGICSNLSPNELLEAQSSLLVYGKTNSNYKYFLMGFSKKYAFTGKCFQIKTYQKPLIKDGIEIGYPVYYEYLINTKKINIPEKTGIYHLFYNGILVYIGFSRNIKNRLKRHSYDSDMVFDAVLWFIEKDLTIRGWLDLEKKMIQYWKPSLNRNYVE